MTTSWTLTKRWQNPIDLEGLANCVEEMEIGCLVDLGTHDLPREEEPFTIYHTHQIEVALNELLCGEYEKFRFS